MKSVTSASRSPSRSAHRVPQPSDAVSFQNAPHRASFFLPSARSHPPSRPDPVARVLGGRRLEIPPLRLLGLRALRSADGEPPCPAGSVRLLTPAVHLPVHPWSPRSQGFPREADASRHGGPAASHRYERRRRREDPAPQSGLGEPRELAPMAGSRRAARAGHTLRTNSAAISPAGSSASASPAQSHDVPHGIRRGGPAEPGSAGRGHGWPAPPRASQPGLFPQADLAALGVWLVFSRENVPDPFRPKGTATNGTVVRK